MSEQQPSTGARYKEIAALATDAVERMNRLERERADTLQEQATADQERLRQAQQEEEEVTHLVDLRWNNAMEELWEERWMQVTKKPAPDYSAPPAGKKELERRVQAAWLDLYHALGRSQGRSSRRASGLGLGRFRRDG